MKATGIVRRIDDLGRVVIPKEIRRTMRIREGEIRWDTNDTIGYVEQTAAFHGGTLYEEFRSAFDDIIALGAKKAALEQEPSAS